MHAPLGPDAVLWQSNKDPHLIRSLFLPRSARGGASGTTARIRSLFHRAIRRIRSSSSRRARSRSRLYRSKARKQSSRFGANDFFGEACLAGQARRIATVAAMADSVIVRLEKAAIIRLIHIEPAFAEMFIAHLLDRTICVEADLVDQLFNSSEKRLARLLLLLANFGKDGQPEPVQNCSHRKRRAVHIQILICGWSCRTRLNSEP